MTDQPDSRKKSNRPPRVRVLQDDDAPPVRVIVVDDKDNASLGLFAIMIFFATLLGTVIGLGADFSELISSVEDINNLINPPPQLCLTGSRTILGEEGPGQEWRDAFIEGRDMRFRIIPTGSVGGIDAAVNGDCAHILAMSEPMTPEQHQTLQDANIELSCAVEVGYDIISFITDINNPLVKDIHIDDNSAAQDRTILLNELRGILRGSITDWSQTANWPLDKDTNDHPITIWVRPGSGTTDVVLNRLTSYTSTEDQPFPPNARYRLCNSNEDCLNRTLSTPGSLFWVSVAWMRTQPPNYLRVLYILQGDEVAVNPLLGNIDLGEYPANLVRPLYLYVLDNGSMSDDVYNLARDFLFYTRGVDGQTIVEDRYFYTHFSPPPELNIDVEFPEAVFDIPENHDIERTICKPR